MSCLLVCCTLGTRPSSVPAMDWQLLAQCVPLCTPATVWLTRLYVSSATWPLTAAHVCILPLATLTKRPIIRQPACLCASERISSSRAAWQHHLLAYISAPTLPLPGSGEASRPMHARVRSFEPPVTTAQAQGCAGSSAGRRVASWTRARTQSCAAALMALDDSWRACTGLCRTWSGQTQGGTGPFTCASSAQASGPR